MLYPEEDFQDLTFEILEVNSSRKKRHELQKAEGKLYVIHVKKKKVKAGRKS